MSDTNDGNSLIDKNPNNGNILHLYTKKSRMSGTQISYLRVS